MNIGIFVLVNKTNDSMNITIFGGTGESGLRTINRLLEAGYEVTAFARSPEKIGITHRNLRTVKGELSDYNTIERAIKNAAAVISLLGPNAKSKKLSVSQGTRNIIKAMENNGVKRLIATATPSFQDSNDKFQFGFTIGRMIVKIFLKEVYGDICETGSIVVKSNLDWTLLRLPMLSKKAGTGKISAGYTGDGTVKLFSLSREDLAIFIIKQLEDRFYIHKAPVISN